jgi:hypothetical protein
LKRQLEELELELIVHQYRADGPFREYCKNFRDELELAASLNPVLINSHTGRDYWPNDENGVKIVHETHRGRFPFCAPLSKLYFDQHPELKISADLSHWVYTWTVPFTGLPMADFFDINVYMKDFLKKTLVN